MQPESPGKVVTLPSESGLMFMLTLSMILAIAFAVLAFVHIYWASDGDIGSLKVIPVSNGRPVFIPGVAETLIVALILACFSLVALALGFYGLISADLQPYVKASALAIGVVLILRATGDFKYVGFFKRVRGSSFAKYDDWIYSPFCLLAGSTYIFLVTSLP